MYQCDECKKTFEADEVERWTRIIARIVRANSLEKWQNVPVVVRNGMRMNCHTVFALIVRKKSTKKYGISSRI